MNDSKRVFICLPIPDEVNKEVARIQEQLNKKLQFIGKTTELENLHITLKFIGDVNVETLEKIKSLMKKISFKELNLNLNKLGAFYYKNQPKIIWLKVTGDAFNIQKEVDLALKELLPQEERFMSHMTIARIKYTKDVKYFKEYIKHIKPKKITWTSKKVLLNESILKDHGPEYRTIEKYLSEKDK